MTPDEIRIVDALTHCSFCPGSSPKRFVRQMAARDQGCALTERQRAYLWAIAWSWRRQLPNVLVDLARRYSGGVGIRGRKVNEEPTGSTSCASPGSARCQKNPRISVN